MNKNQIETAAKELEASESFKKIESQLTPKLYYHRFRAIYLFCVIAIFIIHAFSIATSFFFTKILFFSYFNNLSQSVFFALTILVLIEVLKHFTISAQFESHFVYKSKNILNLSFVTGLIGLSLYLSCSGTGEAYKQNVSKPNLYIIDEMVKNDSAEIKKLEKQLENIQKTQSWDNGNLTPEGRESYNLTSEDLKNVKSRCQVTREKYVKLNEQINLEHDKLKKNMSSNFKLIALVLDISLMFCLSFKWTYQKQTYLEIKALQDKVAAEKTTFERLEMDKQEALDKIAELEGRTGEMQEEIAEKDSILQEKEQIISKMQEEIAEKDSKMIVGEGDSKELLGQIGKLKSDISLKNLAFDRLNLANKQYAETAQKQIEELEINLTAEREKNVKLNKELDILSKENVKLKDVKLAQNTEGVVQKMSSKNVKLNEELDIDTLRKERDNLNRKINAYKSQGYNESNFTEAMKEQIEQYEKIKDLILKLKQK